MQAFWLSTLIAISTFVWGDEARIADCSSIESDLERLNCYDERTAADRREQERDTADVAAPTRAPRAEQAPVQAVQPGAVAEPGIDEAEPAVVKVEPAVVEAEPAVVEAEPAVVEAELPVAVEPAIAVDVPSAAAVESTIAVVEPAIAKAEPRQDRFGRRTAGPTRGTQLASRIESIRTAPRGHHVMTLSNGQTWAENEPSARRIKAGQDVTIIKSRFHYDMRLKSGRTIAVHRLEDD